ncbi:MAG TPA: DUF1343 domain-containing protein [Thermoanaerobaculia bacterium]|jgi:uncharacterized protein YbbC (DUF1343 family)|nr:DUF1343 domain-containing protein [Thermoanaerobaculia bacterium]
MIRTGLDRLLAAPQELQQLRRRAYGLLAHGAAVTGDLRPIHRALAAGPAGAPRALFGPEHGYYGVEQDMVPAHGGTDPWTGAPIVSLYGDGVETLRPSTSAFAGLDLLLVDLQDVGTRYYTYAATAVWAAEAALAAGLEVWVLDRPNPLGGMAVEGNLPQAGYESFVGAFRLPVRHGLTLGELVLLAARRGGWRTAPEVWPLDGWDRSMLWQDTGLAWIAPSPNMPSAATALIYPGGCLVEATELSEGRGTTRPFQLIGAPGIDPPALADDLNARGLPGVAFLPVCFRPQFQKHCGEVCGGVELVVTDPRRFRSYRTGVELLRAVARLAPRQLVWRRAAYEFVSDRPAIDLLTGGPECRTALAAGGGALDAWMDTWPADEESFRRERRGILLYPEVGGEA